MYAAACRTRTCRSSGYRVSEARRATSPATKLVVTENNTYLSLRTDYLEVCHVESMYGFYGLSQVDKSQARARARQAPVTSIDLANAFVGNPLSSPRVEPAPTRPFGLLWANLQALPVDLFHEDSLTPVLVMT